MSRYTVYALLSFLVYVEFGAIGYPNRFCTLLSNPVFKFPQDLEILRFRQLSEHIPNNYSEHAVLLLLGHG